MENKLKDLDIFEGLPDEGYSKIVQVSEEIALKEGEVLFQVSEPGDKLYVVVNGLLKISRQDPLSNREKTLALLSEGEIVGEMACMANQGRSGTATAVKDATLLAFTKEKFIALFEEYSEIGLNLFNTLSERLLEVDNELFNFAFLNIPGRLATCLFRLADKFGRKVEDGVKIDLDLTHEQLASIVGTNRETITRYINRLQEVAGIRCEDHKIVLLDRSKLKKWL